MKSWTKLVSHHITLKRAWDYDTQSLQILVLTFSMCMTWVRNLFLNLPTYLKIRDVSKYYGIEKLLCTIWLLQKQKRMIYLINNSFHENCQHLGRLQYPFNKTVAVVFGSLNLVQALISLGPLVRYRTLHAIKRLRQRWLCWQGSLYTYETDGHHVL